MARIVVTLPDKKTQRTYALVEKLTSIGRMPACTIQIDDKVASRKHCIIKQDGDTYTLEDMGSANGTQVNGSRVKKHRLAHTDRIQIGDTILVFEES